MSWWRAFIPGIAVCTPGWAGILSAQSDSAEARRLVLSGYAEVSYTYATHAQGSFAVGRLYDRFNDQFGLNGLTLMLDLPPQPTRLSASLHAELLLGQNAAVIKSAGFDLGNNADAPQLYGTLNIPTSNHQGIQIRLGRMPSLLGVEVIETTANPNWSVANQFIYLENFTQTGLSVEHRFNDHVDAQFRIFNGWDVVEDNNTRKSSMARLGLAGGPFSLALLGYYGPEQAGNSTDDRYGGEAIVGAKIGGKTAIWMQGDVGGEEANPALPDPTRDAGWWGIAGWITHDLATGMSLALRGDYIDDRDGARTSGLLGFPSNTGQRLGSVTATLNLRSWEGLLLRPELRYDRSDLAAFDGKQDQLTFAAAAAYFF